MIFTADGTPARNRFSSPEWVQREALAALEARAGFGALTDADRAESRVRALVTADGDPLVEPWPATAAGRTLTVGLPERYR